MGGCDYGNFMEMASFWAPSPSPSPSAIFAMLDQSDNGLNPTSDIFPPQSNLSGGRNQPEQRPSLRERVAARMGFNIPPIQTKNMSSFGAPFRNPTAVPSPVAAISPGFTPSALLQSPDNFLYSNLQLPPLYPIANDGPPEMLESSGDDHETTMVFNNDVPHHPMHVDLPPQEGSDVIPTEDPVKIPSHESHVDPIGAPLANSFEPEVANDTDVTNLISLDDEIEDEDEEYKEDEDEDEDEDDHIVGYVEPSPPKRRKYEASNIIGATRTSKKQRVIIQIETDENHPDDGFRWRKYGQKIVKGNPNPRSYYKCTDIRCDVKKHVERGPENARLVVSTYDGVHNHAAPTTRISSSGPRNRSGSSMSQYHTKRTARQDKPPSSLSSAPQDMRSFPSSSAPGTHQYMRTFPSSLDPSVDMTQLYMTGLSKLQNLPVNNPNHGFMGRNDEPKTDRVIPDGSEVYKGIMHRLFVNFGVNPLDRQP